MRPSRPLDALYDPMYMVSGRQIAGKGQNASPGRRPRFQELFTDLRGRAAPAGREQASPGQAAATPGSAVGINRPPNKPEAPVSSSSSGPNKPAIRRRDTPWAGSKPAYTQADRRTASPPRLAAYQPAQPRHFALDDATAAAQQRLKTTFEASLPPLTDAKNINLRRKLLEAWNAAHWQEREAYIAKMQEQHINALQHAILQQEHEAEQRLLQRLNARYGKTNAAAQQSLDVLHRQHEAYAAQLRKKHQQLQQRTKGTRHTRLDGLMAPVVGHKVVRSRRFGSPAPLAEEEVAAAGAVLPKQADLNASHHRGSGSGSGAPKLGTGSASDARKQAEYVQALEAAYRALEEEKATGKSAAGPSGGESLHGLTSSNATVHAAAVSDSSPGSQAGFNGLLAEEDDLLPVVLGAPPPPQTLDQIINEAAAQHARPAPAPLTQVPSIVGNTESGSSAEVDEQQSGLIGEGAATMEHEIGNVLEALLMHAESAASEQEAARAGPYWESAHYTPEGSSSYGGQAASTTIDMHTLQVQQAAQPWLTEQPSSDLEDCMLVDSAIDILLEGIISLDAEVY